MIRPAVFALLLGASAALAQEAPEGLAQAGGAHLRGLDKVAGGAVDITLAQGGSVAFGSLMVALKECRYPAEDPASNAYAYLSITDAATGQSYFDGWMIADSPALSALDHQRYDVWVMRCKID